MKNGFTGIILVLLGLQDIVHCTAKKEGGQEGYQSIRQAFGRSREC
jgi:hypothetical protein